MNETTWIIDAATGELTVEGLPQSALLRLAGDLLPDGRPVNCARPINTQPLRVLSSRVSHDGPSLRVHHIYHNSVVEGPGRRSVLRVAGCNLRCPGFIYSLGWANYDVAHGRHEHNTTANKCHRLVESLH